MKKYLYYSKILFIATIGTSIIANAVAIVVAFVLQTVVDAGVNLDISALERDIWFCILMVIADVITIYLNQLVNSYYQYHTMKKIREDVFNSLVDTDINVFQSDNTAKYISIFNNDIKIIQQCYIQTIPSMISHVCQFILALAALIYIDPLIAIVSLVINIFPILVPIVFGKSLSKNNEEYLKSVEKYNIKLKDVFSGFETIKSYYISDKIKDEHKIINEEIGNKAYCFDRIKAFFSASSKGCGDFVFIGILVIATFLVINGRMTLGMMIACIQLLNYVVNPINMLANEFASLKSVKTVNERILEAMTLKKDVVSGQYEKSTAYITLRPEYQLNSLSFAYDENTPVLKNISLTIRQGKKYAVVGGSGCGKSTLLKVMLKYYDYYQGEIQIDGIPLSNIRKDELYHNVAILHQNVFLFNDTLAHNIALYRSYPENDIIEVIKRVGLMDKVAELSNGINTKLDENGQNFSGGERQRIAIARALLRRTPVIFMDEATSALDAETAYQIESSILVDKELTAVIVTHHLSETLLRCYDEILMMKNGIITEQGSFDDLINSKKDFYSLYQMSI